MMFVKDRPLKLSVEDKKIILQGYIARLALAWHPYKKKGGKR